MLDHIIRSMLRVSYVYVSQRGCALRDRGGWAIGDWGGRVSLRDKTTHKVRGH